MTEDFKTLAAQLRDLQDATKAQIAGVMARAEDAGLDPAGLRRFVSWKRKDEGKRAQQEAIDQQCRYLAGERDTPAQLPIGCELAQALNLYRRGLTVRQVSEELRVSTGKAGKLKQLSRMFDVHVHATVDKLTPHDPDTGEITETAPDVPVEGAAIGPEIGSGSLATTNGQEMTNGREAEGHDGAGQEASLRGQPDSQDAGGDPGRAGEARNGRDDRREDGGGFRGVGAPQDQLATEGDSPQRVARPNDPPPIPSFLRRQASR